MVSQDSTFLKAEGASVCHKAFPRLHSFRIPSIRIRARRHVNRKALDQYAAFTDQRAELARRQEENSRGEAKIKQLIDTLDLRKDEAIERTFKVRRLSHSSFHRCMLLGDAVFAISGAWVLCMMLCKMHEMFCMPLWHVPSP